jgi:hypothetical protein
MKNLVTSLLKNSAVIVLLLNGIQTVYAQKLPTIQTGSVKAPENIKIDGKPTEWPKFEAYNNATEFFYTISNDNNNLYIVMQATHSDIISKILAGGITFTIKNADKSNSITPASITYPYSPSGGQGVGYTIRTNKTLSEEQLTAINKQVSGDIKEIPLTGLKGINEEKISLYNDLGLRANGLVDHQKAYTCEIVIPLKYIQQVIDANGKFSYRLQVNGLDTSGKDGFIVVGGQGANPSAQPVSHDSGNFMLSPTYLDGTYTLAK